MRRGAARARSYGFDLIRAVQRTVGIAGPLDLVRTVAPLRRGTGDPTHRVVDADVWRTVPTPDGPATMRLSPVDSGVCCVAWGAGAQWSLDRAPGLVGVLDDPGGFDPAHPLLHELHRRHPGLRLPRTGLVLDQLVPAVLEQKVTGAEARRSWRELVTRFGTPAPGPAPPGMWVAPVAVDWLALPTWEWHRAGVDLPRQRAIRAAATVAGRLEECVRMCPVGAERRLRVVPGVGAWTAAEVGLRALGDADAVSVGDYHLAGLVGWALTGAKTDDAGMLALLDGYRPHRQRVIRLLEVAGARPPRRGPRLSPRDHRRR